jgi:alkylation response protein AidB-like acyl-CoA dehydrogenase
MDPEKPDQSIEALLARTRELCRSRIAPRAAEREREDQFPSEDFADLFAAGLTAAAVPRDFGGLGLGPRCGQPLALWLLTRELARVNLSLARCYEGHANSMVLIDAMGTDDQKSAFFAGVVRRGELWAAWSGEPQTRLPGSAASVGTTVTKCEQGVVLSGSKVFATSAGGATHALLLVSAAGPGGARHHDGPADALLLLACDLRDPSIEIDRRWWDPVGMRATVSHRVCFHNTFIPAGQQIGEPGQYLRDGWQSAFAPHYAASFLGAAEGVYEYTLATVSLQGRSADPYVQQRVAKMALAIETSDLWLRHVAACWQAPDRGQAQLAGSRARYLVEQLAEETLQHAIHVCGARCLLRPSIVERMLRDLTFYLRHDNDDHILATIGRAILGGTYDLSFYRP